MPYIDKESRKRLLIDGDPPRTAGELNFVITRGIMDTLYSHYDTVGYQALNDAIGEIVFIQSRLTFLDCVPDPVPSRQDWPAIIEPIYNFITQQNEFTSEAHRTILGVLECVKLELYRRVAAPYEDRKIEENGDVF